MLLRPIYLLVGTQAPRISQNHIAIPGSRWRRPPPTAGRRGKHLAWLGPMMPNGDRRHDSESGRIVREPNVAALDQEVMAELIVRYHVVQRQRRPLAETPIQSVLDRAMAPN